jgi:L-fuconolactonase
VKLSDLPPYASENWTEDELRPYIEATLDAFGPDRTIYAGDYPILLQSTSMMEWVQVLDNSFADLGLSEAETRKIYRDNAIDFYRLDL